MKPSALCLVLLILTGCGTLAPGASNIRVSRDPVSVQSCVALGSVGADVNDVTLLLGDWNGEGWYKIRNQALALHADHVLITSSRFAPDAGVAYRCEVRP